MGASEWVERRGGLDSNKEKEHLPWRCLASVSNNDTADHLFFVLVKFNSRLVCLQLILVELDGWKALN